MKEIKEKRKNLLTSLAVTNKDDEIRLISCSLLSNWLSSSDVKFQPESSLLTAGMCEHRMFDSFSSKSIKCINASKAESLLKEDFGICASVPFFLKVDEALCLDCVSRDVHHILFRENLKEISKQVKKEASKDYELGQKPIGQRSLKLWHLIALNSYMKKNGFLDYKANGITNQTNSQKEEVEENLLAEKLETDSCNGSGDLSNGCSQPLNNASESNSLKEHTDEIKSNKSTEEDISKSDYDEPNDDGRKCEINADISLFNQDIVCPHKKRDPQVSVLWLSTSTMEKIQNLCKESLHPLVSKEDFDVCPQCQEFMDESEVMCVQGKMERKWFSNLYSGKKRPVVNRDVGVKFYLIDNDFVYDWKSYLRNCEKGNPDLERPQMIDNSNFICEHDEMKYCSSKDGSLLSLATFVSVAEWTKLNEFYLSTHTIEAFYDQTGNMITTPSSCTKGCVEAQAVLMYEEQFNFEWGCINIKQVNSVSDIPSVQNGIEEENLPRKRQKTIKAIEAAGGNTPNISVNQRLVRASKEFCSNDTIKQVQNFIAEKTGIWPILQTMWLRGGIEHGPEPLLLNDDHRNMTLRSLRIKESDTIYFKAAMEDMEIAAGDGISEFNEMEEFEFNS